MPILVADDDIFSVKMTSFILEEAGYKVIRAYDGQSALQAIEKHEPELVLLDVAMPAMSGFEACRQIRQVSDVPIIFLSARSQLQERVTGLQIGGDDYVVKPFEPLELLARIEAVLRRRGDDMVITPTRLNIGPFTLDPVEQRISRSDAGTARLTPVEFRLLYFLMKNAGRPLTTAQILEKVWGYEQGSGSNLVAVYVRRLRMKIERDVDVPEYLVTVPNLGYKFVA